MKGFAALIGLLIAAVILVIVFLTFAKTSLNSNSTTSTTKIDEAQKAVNDYQQKSIQNQLQEAK